MPAHSEQREAGRRQPISSGNQYRAVAKIFARLPHMLAGLQGQIGLKHNLIT